MAKRNQIVKRLLGLASAFALLAGLAAVSQATNPDMFKIRVAINRTVSVDVSTSPTVGHEAGGAPLDFGTIASGAQVVCSTPVYVMNTSPAASAAIQSYSAYISGTPAGWTLNTTTLAGNADQAAVGAVFAPAAPAWGAFANDDVLGTGVPGGFQWASNGGPLDPASGSYNIANVAVPGKHYPQSVAGFQPLKLWVALAAPTAVTPTGAGQQTITVTVTAY